jgi:23S rRNA (uracil1939-C5)-methyltransferase
VRGALPGDRMRARVTKRKRRHAEALAVELLRPSSERVPRRCPHDEDCGGCEWQALPYERQLDFKQSQVDEALGRIGGLEGYVLEPILGMDDPWRYRNNMEFSFGVHEGALVLGLHRKGSWSEIVEIDDCLLASERANAARAAVAEVARELGLEAYDRVGGHGLLRHLVVREGRASGDLLLNLYVRRRFPEERVLAEAVRERCAPTSFGVTVNDAPADAAIGDGPHMVFGPPFLRERLAGVDLRVPATAFLQTNSAMTDRLYETAAGYAAPADGQAAVDLYCGIGSFTLRLAQEAVRVTGVELQPEAVQAARENAALNEAAHAAFFAGDVRRLLKEPATVGLDPDRDPPAVVAVDPPRAGLARKALQRAAGLGARRFVYISCNPTTLAGNGAELAELGYRLTRVQPVDMFPHTHHVESVALFERSST